MQYMKTHNHRQPKGLSDAEFEAALHAALRDEGKLFPSNAEDIASLEASMDMNNVPTPDAQEFHRFLRECVKNEGHSIKNVQKSSHPLKSTREVIKGLLNKGKNLFSLPEVDADLANLAGVARNGGEITEGVRKRMEADRSQAEEKTKNQNGTC